MCMSCIVETNRWLMSIGLENDCARDENGNIILDVNYEVRPTRRAADAKGICPTCNGTGYIIDGGEVWGACDCDRLPLHR